MPHAVITVASVQAPGQGKKQGKVTDTDGGVWNVWGDKLHHFQNGVSYKIVYDENEFNNKKFYVVKTWEPMVGAPPPAARPATSPAAPVFPTQKDEMIFVCGALNNALGNPAVNPTQLTTAEIATFVNTLRQVWRLTLASGHGPEQQEPKLPSRQASRQQYGDPDDGIPF